MNAIFQQKLESLRQKFSSQSHVFHWLDKQDLKPDEINSLIEQLEKIDIENILSRLSKSFSNQNEQQNQIQPIQKLVRRKECTPDERERWTNLTLAAIAQGTVGVILLAGGQGTRLGFDNPKGMYNIGLPGSGSLFQKQAEQIRRLKELSAEASGKTIWEISLPWYIMTSPMTDQSTQLYFRENDYFGIEKKEIFFFQQGTLPCFTENSKIIMQGPANLATAPDGNGGIYAGLLESGALEHMTDCGIEHLFQYCVDNAAIKVADPVFLGNCIEHNVEIAGKAVEKKDPEEQVGVFCEIKERLHVLEYSDIDNALSRAKDPQTGNLLLSSSHVCINYFSRGFLEKVTNDPPDQYHLARKKIPYAGKDGDILIPEQPNGIKLESFIFDVFQRASAFRVFECHSRKEEFAPVKNPPGTQEDSPDTARKLCSDLHREQLLNAGALITGKKSDLIEISPLASYSGEGLEKVLKGAQLQSPLFIRRMDQKEKNGPFRHIKPENTPLGVHVYEV